jgi:hypothetical protein
LQADDTAIDTATKTAATTIIAAAAKTASALLVGATVVGALALGSPSTARAADSVKPYTGPVTTSPAATSSSVSLTNPFDTIQSAIAGPKKFTITDLQAALDDANAQTPPDTRHAPCWSALLVIANSNITNPFPNSLGLAQLVQKGFDLQATLNDQTWKDKLATGCALTVLDLGTNLNALLAKIGVSALPIPKL